MKEFKLPPPFFADQDGLLAVGGSLTAENLLEAYRAGVYYWHHPLKRVHWWSPDPRIVLYPGTYVPDPDLLCQGDEKEEIRFNEGFESLLRLCQERYNKQEQMDPTWLSERMFRIFLELHKTDHAHSVEAWEGNKLVGGIFGITLGGMFFGEYQVARDQAMAVRLLTALLSRLKERGYELLDMQKPSVFIRGVEYEEIARVNFVNLCKESEENTAALNMH
jgi:leucyl/phenylalanyl-tRNA--protein transferase